MHGVRIDLKDIQCLLQEDPIDKEIAARRIRMCTHYWIRSYKGACPESLSKLISYLEALATHMKGTPTSEGPVHPAEVEARSYLGKLDAAFTEANDEIEHGLSGREALDSTHLQTASQLQEVSKKAKENEVQTLLERAQEFKANLDARTSELVLKRPQCIADLVHPQAGAEENLLLDLPVESGREGSNAHDVHIDLKDIHRLLQEDIPSTRRLLHAISACAPTIGYVATRERVQRV